MVLDVTTTTRVVDRFYQGTTETLRTANIQVLITSVSAQAQDFMGASIQSEAFSEKFTPYRGQRIFRLFHAPISAITSVTNDETVLDSDDYDFDGGLLYLKRDVVFDDPLSLVVAGTGGMADDTTEVISDFPVVSERCEWWVSILSSWNQNPDQIVVSNDGGTFTRIPSKMPDEVIRALTPYRNQ